MTKVCLAAENGKLTGEAIVAALKGEDAVRTKTAKSQAGACTDQHTVYNLAHTLLSQKDMSQPDRMAYSQALVKAARGKELSDDELSKIETILEATVSRNLRSVSANFAGAITAVSKDSNVSHHLSGLKAAAGLLRGLQGAEVDFTKVDVQNLLTQEGAKLARSPFSK